jgi:hypothetical protein
MLSNLMECFQHFNRYRTPTGKRPRHRWKGNIRIDLKGIGINMRNWVDSAQDRDYWRVLVNVALNLQVP